ncbi:Zinc transporter ZIP11 [Hondaea fermentalgiana]|uniref:Zinc transporter ZIP11 n=1 Tax=Hondaea fermentalgiana TaxID=2315210 RepID=A0A2R5GST9_9STRA|nr:Zinc transporter ZIP11 [Hondaea fermentalgiana]|eukprot:GBG32828.1 Zinc transporter ZIP11 [Hondaea fermentalgiana]
MAVLQSTMPNPQDPELPRRLGSRMTDDHSSTSNTTTTKVIELGPRDLEEGKSQRPSSGVLENAWQFMLLFLAGLLTVHSVNVLQRDETEGVMLVWSSAWVTAACSALGVVPFFFIKDLECVAGAGNALAAGVMTAASLGLLAEGLMEPTTPDTAFEPSIKVLVGMYLGVGFMKASERLITEKEAVDLAEAKSWRRAVVIMMAMTFHAFAEGVGIGVAFRTHTLGSVVSLSLALHNVPEGIAVAVVLIPRGFSSVATALMCILSSIPQPLMAVPAFIFVDSFASIIPIGFGFASSAMLMVSTLELMPEALAAISACRAYSIMFCSMLAMCALQVVIRTM